MTESASSGQTINLPEQATTAAAAEVYTALKEADGKPVTIDASQVQRLGAQVVQVLLAAESHWLTQGQSFSIENPSDTFIETGRRLGLAHQIHTDGETT